MLERWEQRPTTPSLRLQRMDGWMDEMTGCGSFSKNELRGSAQIMGITYFRV